MPELKNQYLIVYILYQLVQQVCKCELVPQNNIGSQPKYPFVSYQIITAEEDTTTDVTSQLSVTLQIDCHDSDQIRANSLAHDLRSALRSDNYRRYFRQVNIVPYGATPTSDRTTLPFVNYDQVFGFDCSFLVAHKDEVFSADDLDFTYSDEDIRTIYGQGTYPTGKQDFEIGKED